MREGVFQLKKKKKKKKKKKREKERELTEREGERRERERARTEEDFFLSRSSLFSPRLRRQSRKTGFNDCYW